MYLNGKLRKTGGEQGLSKNMGGHGPPRLPLESPLPLSLKQVMFFKIKQKLCANVPKGALQQL